MDAAAEGESVSTLGDRMAQANKRHEEAELNSDPMPDDELDFLTLPGEPPITKTKDIVTINCEPPILIPARSIGVVRRVIRSREEPMTEWASRQPHLETPTPILNLSGHQGPPEWAQEGVVNLTPDEESSVRLMLSRLREAEAQEQRLFADDLGDAAKSLTQAYRLQPVLQTPVLVVCGAWAMKALVNSLKSRLLRPVSAYSRRAHEKMDDGRLVVVRRHGGFIDFI